MKKTTTKHQDMIQLLKTTTNQVGLNPSTIRRNRRYLESVFSNSSPKPLIFTRKLALILAICLIFISLPTAQAAADAALPGDFLYPLDRFFETVQLAVTVNPVNRQQLETQIITERLDEIAKLTQKHQQNLAKQKQETESVTQEVKETLKKYPQFDLVLQDFDQLNQDGLTASETASLKERINTTSTQVPSKPTPTTEIKADTESAVGSHDSPPKDKNPAASTIQILPTPSAAAASQLAPGKSAAIPTPSATIKPIPPRIQL